MTDQQQGNSLIYGIQVEHHPGRIDGKDVTVHTDVGDLHLTRAQYDRALTTAKDTESFRMALFEQTLADRNTQANQGSTPVTEIGAMNPPAGTVAARQGETESGPPNTISSPGTVQQPTVGPGGLPNDPATQSGIETMPNNPPNYPGEPPDGSGETVNEGGEPGEP